MKYEDRKVNTSIAVSRNLLVELRELKEKRGISISWLISTLLNNYFKSLRGRKDEQ